MHPLTFDRSRITRAETKRAVVDAAATTLAGVAVLLLAALLTDPHGVEIVRGALEKSAQAPPNASVIEQGFATVQGNWYWFLLITFPLALSILMGAVGLGVRSASDWLFRLVMAVVGVIAFSPAIVA